ncbi:MULTISPECIES: TIGR04104 family putative zinc finger protein [Paraliobacillus]|uniref:TIGR04104 family putative zinc finger protein n=1 Tax=Paraliobacillus TaxID=200903 RepID=UPI000DD45515
MQKCEKCNTKFSRRSIYRLLWGTIEKPLICVKCGAEHYITIRGRLTNACITILPMLVFMQFLSPFNNILLTMGIGLFILFIGFLLTPYLVTFKVDRKNTN